MFKQNFLSFSLSPLSLLPSLHTTEKNLTASSLHPLFRYLYTSVPLQAEQFQLSILPIGQMGSSSPLNISMVPSLDWLHYVHVFAVWGSPALAQELQMWLSSAEQKCSIPSSTCWQHSAQCSPGSCWLFLPPGLTDGSHSCCLLNIFCSLNYCSMNVAYSSVLVIWILFIWDLAHTSENSSH